MSFFVRQSRVLRLFLSDFSLVLIFLHVDMMRTWLSEVI